ncbi:hypothetical protein Ndes2526A_g02745 [Nannochloris sp. 'desiccata']
MSLTSALLDHFDGTFSFRLAIYFSFQMSHHAVVTIWCSALLLLLLHTALPVEAGCKKRRATNVQPHEWSLNAQAPSRLLTVNELPQNFSWLDVNGVNMVAPSWNQHIGEQYCGACWAHGTLSMIQDRLKIVKKGAAPDVTLGRQTLLNCGAFHDYGAGCDGGDVIDVLRYMAQFGLPDESCIPYSATDHTKYDKDAKKCPAIGYCMNCMPIDDVDTCWAVKTPIRYYLESYGQVSGPGEEPMLNEIATNGPITCSMATPEVFDYGYHSGIAMDPSHNATDVDHDVEIVGWGVSPSGTKYWIVRNSWGTYFGQLGFFLLERGNNALQIEAGDCWWANPTWEDEQDVRAGKKVGTMWGIMTPAEAAKVLPEPATKPKKKEPDDNQGSGAAQEGVEVEVELLGKRDPWKKERMMDVKRGNRIDDDGMLSMATEQ